MNDSISAGTTNGTARSRRASSTAPSASSRLWRSTAKASSAARRAFISASNWAFNSVNSFKIGMEPQVFSKRCLPPISSARALPLSLTVFGSCDVVVTLGLELNCSDKATSLARRASTFFRAFDTSLRSAVASNSPEVVDDSVVTGC